MVRRRGSGQRGQQLRQQREAVVEGLSLATLRALTSLLSLPAGAGRSAGSSEIFTART